MIRSIAHKGLMRYFTKSEAKGIPAAHLSRIERILDRLDVAQNPQDMDTPGLKFHPLRGDREGAYAVSVSGNWRITFAFDGADAIDVNLEDYH